MNIIYIRWKKHNVAWDIWLHIWKKKIVSRYSVCKYGELRYRQDKGWRLRTIALLICILLVYIKLYWDQICFRQKCLAGIGKAVWNIKCIFKLVFLELHHLELISTLLAEVGLYSPGWEFSSNRFNAVFETHLFILEKQHVLSHVILQTVGVLCQCLILLAPKGRCKPQLTWADSCTWQMNLILVQIQAEVSDFFPFIQPF